MGKIVSFFTHEQCAPLYHVWIREVIFLTNVQTHSWLWWKMGVLPPKFCHNLWEEYLFCSLFPPETTQKIRKLKQIFDKKYLIKIFLGSNRNLFERKREAIGFVGFSHFQSPREEIFRWICSISKCSLERKHFSIFSLNILRNLTRKCDER